MESSKISDEFKLDDKKEKLYEIKLRSLSREITNTNQKSNTSTKK